MSKREISSILPYGSMKRIADRLGVSPSWVTMVCKGKRRCEKVEKEALKELKALKERIEHVLKE